MHTPPIFSCPICSYESYFSAADSKIIDCRKCGAPVYNQARPSAGNDLKDYQERLRMWGSKSYKLPHIEEAATDKHQHKKKQSANEDNLEKQNINLRSQISSLKGEIYKLNKNYSTLLEKYNSDTTPPKDSRENLSDKYRALRDNYSILQKELSQFAEGIRERNRSDERCADRLVSRLYEKYKELEHAEANALELAPKAIGQDSFLTVSRSSETTNSILENSTAKSSMDREKLTGIYNQNFSALSKGILFVEQTEASLRRFYEGQNDQIQLERSHTGKYCVVLGDEIREESTLNAYLVPRKSIRLNSHNIVPVKACFIFENEPSSGTLYLITPAIVRQVQGRSQWQLVEKGKIKFQEAIADEAQTPLESISLSSDSNSTGIFSDRSNGNEVPELDKVFLTTEYDLGRSNAEESELSIKESGSQIDGSPLPTVDISALSTAINYDQSPGEFQRIGVVALSRKSQEELRVGKSVVPTFSPLSQGDYWIVTNDNNTFYLVLKKNILINANNLETLQIIYPFSGQPNASPAKRRYKRLAEVKPQAGNTWILDRKGEVSFQA